MSEINGKLMIEMNEKLLGQYEQYLRERELSPTTVRKYLRDAARLSDYAAGRIAGKDTLISFKAHLMQTGRADASVNCTLAAVNSFLRFAGREEWKLRFLKIQRSFFFREERSLSQQEYERMVCRAIEQGDQRLAMLLQTICILGIRVSELSAVTAEALAEGSIVIHLKGRIRTILLPRNLAERLSAYCRENNIRSGPVFITRSGRALDRSNIWRMMKRIAAEARVEAKKSYPHNLRHLFARRYYEKYGDIVRLADILGHSSVDTTRIYTARTGREQRRQMNSLFLVL